MIKAKTIHHDAVEAIAGWITGGKYRPGESLPIEPAICEALGVSRTVVREAVKILLAKGLVSSGPRVGTRVLPTKSWNLYDPQVIGWRLAAGVDDQFLRDVIDLRLAIEPSAAALAAVHASEADLTLIRESYAAMEHAVEHEVGYFDADLRFHTDILRATHNQFFVAFIPTVAAILKVSIQFSVKNRTTVEASLPLHKAVADAVCAGDHEQSARAFHLLITRAWDDIESKMEPDAKFVRGAA